jgi:anthranilate synthase component II
LRKQFNKGSTLAGLFRWVTKQKDFMKILVFDNYDSFTYNLVHLVEKIIQGKVEVHRNDQISLERVKDFDKIILSPGPGIPTEAGLLLPLIRQYASSKSILGVCLGHQAIGEAFGGTLVNLKEVYHGVALPVQVLKPGGSASRLFDGMPDRFDVGRYHSWVVAPEGFPAELEITAQDDNGLIMGLQHRNLDIQGVQFHPESVLTPLGEQIVRNWMKK